MEEAQRKLPFIQKMAYSVGHLLNDLAASMWFSYLLVYFHEVRHIDNITAGYLMLVGQITDALFTPFVGIEVDRTTGLCGMARNKTWHLIGTISFAASYPFLFNACIGCDNNTSDLAQFIYYTPFFVISQIGWACTQIAHLSLIPVLTSDENERVELNGLRYAFTVLSNLLVFGIFWSIFEFGKTSHKDTILLSPADGPKFRMLVFIVVGVGIIACLLFQCIVKEPKLKEPVCTQDCYSQKMPFQTNKMNWRDWFTVFQFYQVGLMYMCSRLFVNVSQIYLPLWITETLKFHKKAVAIFPLIVYASGFVTSVGMRPLHKYIGRKGMFMAGLITGIGSCVWMFFLDKDTANMAYGAAVLLGIGGSTLLVTSLAMTADLIDNNVESGGFVYGAMSFADKFANGIAVVTIQALNPCTTTCSRSGDYYRIVLAWVPGGAAVFALIILLSILQNKIGHRKIIGAVTLGFWANE